MKSTGIIRKIDELGRIVLPIELRRTLDIAERDELEIYLDDDKVVLKKYEPSCIFCNSSCAVLMPSIFWAQSLRLKVLLKIHFRVTGCISVISLF